MLENRGAFTWGETVTQSRSIKIIIWLVTETDLRTAGNVDGAQESAGIGVKSGGGGGRKSREEAGTVGQLTGAGGPGRLGA